MDQIKVDQQHVAKFWIFDGTGDPVPDLAEGAFEVEFSTASAVSPQTYSIVETDSVNRKGEYGLVFTPGTTGLLTARVSHPLYRKEGYGFEFRVQENLLDDLAAQMEGPGNLRQVIEVLDQGSLAPVVGALVEVYDATGVTKIAYGYTGSDGKTSTLMLYAGTYKVFVSKIGQYNFTNPTTVVVAADLEEHPIYGEEFSPTDPPGPGQCTVYGWAVDGSGAALEVEITAQVMASDADLENDQNVVRGPLSVLSDPDNGGYWQLNLTQSGEYVDDDGRYLITVGGWQQGDFLIPTQTSISLKALKAWNIAQES